MLTNTYNFKLIHQNQSQKEILVNEALNKIDQLLNVGAKSKRLTAAPATAKHGDVYIIGNDATEAWAGHDNNIALYMDEWHFVSPREGMLFWVLDEEKLNVYNRGVWRPV